MTAWSTGSWVVLLADCEVFCVLDVQPAARTLAIIAVAMRMATLDFITVNKRRFPN